GAILLRAHGGAVLRVPRLRLLLGEPAVEALPEGLFERRLAPVVRAGVLGRGVALVEAVAHGAALQGVLEGQLVGIGFAPVGQEGVGFAHASTLAPEAPDGDRTPAGVAPDGDRAAPDDGRGREDLR